MQKPKKMRIISNLLDLVPGLPRIPFPKGDSGLTKKQNKINNQEGVFQDKEISNAEETKQHPYCRIFTKIIV